MCRLCVILSAFSFASPSRPVSGSLWESELVSTQLSFVLVHSFACQSLWSQAQQVLAPVQRSSDDDGRSSSAGSLCCAHPCLLVASEAKMSCHAVTTSPQCAHNWSVLRALRSLRECVCRSPASTALPALFFWPSHLFTLFHTPLRSISECMVKTYTKALSCALLSH